MARNPDEMVSLEELFDAGRTAVAADPRPVRRPSRPYDTRWWIRRLFIAFALTTVGWGLLYVVGLTVSYPLVFLGILAVGIIQEALRQVHADELPVTVTGRGLTPVRPPTLAKKKALARTRRTGEVLDGVPVLDGLRLAVGRWEDRLVWGERDAKRFAALVVPRISDLVDTRLRQKHGITLAGSPRQARALLGEELWTLLHQPPSRVPSPGDVASIVAKVEGL
ncbi:hypothetical protein GCM10009827_022370 [Dactylosporangium maewongense]|uniref:Integral membrane protein n=1 Tax=Dactylosporangium maewongense TaxID=634393 RepID=A0ABP4KTT6_9ACTN